MFSDTHTQQHHTQHTSHIKTYLTSQHTSTKITPILYGIGGYWCKLKRSRGICCYSNISCSIFPFSGKNYFPALIGCFDIFLHLGCDRCQHRGCRSSCGNCHFHCCEDSRIWCNICLIYQRKLRQLLLILRICKFHNRVSLL